MSQTNMQIENIKTKETFVATATQRIDEYLFVKLNNGEAVTFTFDKDKGYQNDKYIIK